MNKTNRKSKRVSKRLCVILKHIVYRLRFLDHSSAILIQFDLIVVLRWIKFYMVHIQNGLCCTATGKTRPLIIWKSINKCKCFAAVEQICLCDCYCYYRCYCYYHHCWLTVLYNIVKSFDLCICVTQRGKQDISILIK